MGYTYLRNQDKVEQAKALDFFNLNTENYPLSANTFDSLGEAHETLGNAQEAILNYQQSLVLDPNNEHAKARLEVLKTKE